MSFLHTNISRIFDSISKVSTPLQYENPFLFFTDESNITFLTIIFVTQLTIGILALLNSAILSYPYFFKIRRMSSLSMNNKVDENENGIGNSTDLSMQFQETKGTITRKKGKVIFDRESI